MVDLGEQVFEVGDRVITWSEGKAPDNSVTFIPVGKGWTAEERSIKLVARSTGDAQGLYMATTLAPAYARWDVEDECWKFFTAEGNDYPGNWEDGITGDMQVRFGSIAEYEAIASADISPASYLLDGNLIVPSGNGKYSFSSFEFEIADNVEIDANGRKITLPQSIVFGTKALTVTSSVEGGEIIIDVESGTERNTALSLNGKIALRKTGAGTFVSAKSQLYSGGTFVDAGIVQPPDSLDSNDLTYGYDNFKAFGIGEIYVASGATFNLRGNYGYRTKIHLAGGTLLNNCRNMNKTDEAGSGIGSLSADSRVYVTNSIVFGAPGVDQCGNLGGHTLEFYLPNVNTAILYLRQSLTNGTVRTVLGGARILAVNDNLEMMTTTLDLGTPVNIASGKSVNVLNYIATYGDKYMQGGGRINVYGAFTPKTDTFYTCTLHSGATMDLSGRTTVFNTKCTLYNGSGWLPSTSLSFAAPNEGEDTTLIKVRVGTMEKTKQIANSDEPYIVKWGAGVPQNVKFEFAEGEFGASRGYTLESDSTGLKVLAPRGFKVRIW
jgi:autotransporter-associated beta strand protein